MCRKVWRFESSPGHQLLHRVYLRDAPETRSSCRTLGFFYCPAQVCAGAAGRPARLVGQISAHGNVADTGFHAFVSLRDYAVCFVKVAGGGVGVPHPKPTPTAPPLPT